MSTPAGGPRAAQIASSTAVTAAAQVASMLLGGLLAVLITLKFGKTTRTDALFAAYGVYGVLTLLAQSVRLTMAARLVEGESLFARFDRFLAAVLVVVVASGLVLILLGAPIASMLVGHLGSRAEHTARLSLAILWLAASAQLVAALAAAALGVRGEFGFPGLAYVLGGVLSVGVVASLGGDAGIGLVPIALVCGATLTAALVLGRMARAGYRPRVRRLIPNRESLRTLGHMLTGSVASTLWQVSFVISVGFAAHLGKGAVTVYSYAFFAVSVLVAATAGSLAIVLAAPLARDWDREPASLEPQLRTAFRAGTTLAAPVFGIAALTGHDLVKLILGSSLSGHDATSMTVTFLALAGIVVASSASPVPALAAFARSLYGRVALIALAAAGVHVALTAVALQLDELFWLAIATSLASVTAPAMLLWLVFGGRAGGLIVVLGRDLVGLVLVSAAAFLPPAVGAALLGGGWFGVAAAALGLLVFVFLLRPALPEHWLVVEQLLDRLPPRRRERSPREERVSVG